MSEPRVVKDTPLNARKYSTTTPTKITGIAIARDALPPGTKIVWSKTLRKKRHEG